MARREIFDRVTSLLVICLAVSCSNAMQDPTSTVRHHIDGWPRLSGQDLTCKKAKDEDFATTLANMVYFSREGDQEYLTYQEDHLKIILKGLSNILPTWLTFEHFCVGAPGSIRFQINGMSTKTGSLAVYQGTLLSGGETVFAAIMAHELGHILGQKLTSELFAKQINAENNLTFSSDEFEANWNEQMADEIGLELYLRAGWPFEGFISMLQAMDKENSPSDSGARISNKNSHEENKSGPCARGTGSHPHLCWRIANAKDEYKKHLKDYSSWASPQSLSQKISIRHKKMQSKYKQLMIDAKTKASLDD